MIKKAVFPVAGLGTRFFPATKANPKEMLPIVDKPLIQYAAEEAIEAGISELIFVTSSSKRAIEDHFDRNLALEAELEKKNQLHMLEQVKNILPENVSCIYVRQPEAKGLGHAVLCARPVVGKEAFAVILADDLISNKNTGCIAQMVDMYREHKCSILGLEKIDKNDADKYGIIHAGAVHGRVSVIQNIVEKPDPADAPSDMAVVGRYILDPAIFDCIENLTPGANGEYQLTDAIAALLATDKVLGYQFAGVRYDCGNKLGYLQAMVEYALAHPELGEAFKHYIRHAIK
jgi:UTP--glucose-1-phosphate uridylyltransferase